MFSLTGRIFNYRNVGEGIATPVGYVLYDAGEVKDILNVAYDSDDDDNFAIVREDVGWVLYTLVSEASTESVEYDVPLLFEYVDADGNEAVVSETFRIYGVSESRLHTPYIKYIENLATRVGTTELVTVHGAYFDESMKVFLTAGEFCMAIPADELEFTHGNADGTDDSVSFVMKPEYGMSDASGELCAVYDIGLGVGDCGSMEIMTADVEFGGKIGLIRYRYDSASEEAGKIAAAGNAPSTNAKCFYTSSIRLRYDTTDPSGNGYADGGAGGKYGDTMYVRLGPGQDCTRMRYYRVKLKYNRRLGRIRDEQVLDGVRLETGDLVWLAAQMDETEGLWIVQDGPWIGLGTYLSDEESYAEDWDPCNSDPQVPLPVDYTVLPDLGATVADEVSGVCSSNVPVKHGSQVVCGRMRVPGDVLVLTNQIPSGAGDYYGQDGIWEVTCSDWIYRGPAGAVAGNTVDQSGSIIVQTDVDFCKCGVYHIWYYYLNGGCYLATATRTIKVICSGASIVPGNNVVITDYSVTKGTDGVLVGAGGAGTAGDPVREDCVRDPGVTDGPSGTYDAQNAVGAVEFDSGCIGDAPSLRAPNCTYICDCPRHYTVKFDNEYTSSRSGNGFTILFWQHGSDGWHLYAYIGTGNARVGMNYFVYHLHCDGVATRAKVDVNEDIEYRIKDRFGVYTTERTRDAWFVEHGGVLADGFGIVDDSWNFSELDENGDRVMRYKHVLDADTLYQPWSLSCTSVLLATREYGEGEDASCLRTRCADMVNPLKTGICERYISGMEHIFGFRYYRTVLPIDTFCDIYNDYTCVIGDTWNALSTDYYYSEEYGRRVRDVIVTDQCYDADGNECDCEAEGARHGIIEV